MNRREAIAVGLAALGTMVLPDLEQKLTIVSFKTTRERHQISMILSGLPVNDYYSDTTLITLSNGRSVKRWKDTHGFTNLSWCHWGKFIDRSKEFAAFEKDMAVVQIYVMENLS